MNYHQIFIGQEEPAFYCEEGENCYYDEAFHSGYTFGIFIALIVAYFLTRGNND